MNERSALDRRELPSTWPAELRRSTALAIELRGNPIAKALTEGLVINQVTGSTDGFTDPVALASVGPGNLEAYKGAAINVPQELLELAAGAGWKATPLTTALVLGKGRREFFDPAPHLRVVSDAIVRAVNGTGPRFLIVEMPPRFGKSHLISYRTPAWLLANFPQRAIGLCSYGDDFSVQFGRMVRNAIKDHQGLFGFDVSEDSAAANHWTTTLGGSMWTAGVGGSITGKGADLLIIDDPVKNMEEALSVANRDRIWNWYTSTARTRLHAGGVIIVVMTRWHSEDLVGKILAGPDAHEWLEIKLPAIATRDGDVLGRRKGDLLWPSRFDQAEMAKTRAAVGEETWSALYMQTPLDETSIGRVYHAFDEMVHVREVDRDERLTVCCSFDFNVDPMSCVIAQPREYWGDRSYLTNERVAFIEVLDEISLPDSNTQATCDELHQRLRKMAGGRPMKVEVYGDASGVQRKSSGVQSDWEIVRASFAANSSFYSGSFHVESSNPLVRDRVNAVNGMLRSADGVSHVIIDPKARQLVADLKVVRWKRDTNGNATNQIDKGDSKRSHMSDAFGYLIHARREGARSFGERAGLMR